MKCYKILDRLFDEAAHKSTKLTDRSYGALLMAHAKTKQADKVVVTVSIMREKRIKMMPQTYSVVRSCTIVHLDFVK